MNNEYKPAILERLHSGYSQSICKFCGTPEKKLRHNESGSYHCGDFTEWVECNCPGTIEYHRLNDHILTLRREILNLEDRTKHIVNQAKYEFELELIRNKYNIKREL